MSDDLPLEAVFFAALEKGSPEERQAYLDQVSAGNPDFRRRLEKMLAAQAQAGSFLEHPAPNLVATVDDPSVSERPGTVIGPYKLMEQIGEGGMGLVFVAEQQQPVRRKVALKVIKPGMDTRQVVARFEAERQALALMDHPNIAKVHDGGQTAAGRPYFVMELIKGVPITEYCDQNQVPIRERLELFTSVCQAVQHAHQKGIIHRDLKPSNVLVMSHDGTPVVKVIDFGVAKAIGQQLTEKTIYTQFSQMVGTPLYMSPEQARMSGLDVDTRSDIYSLGVLLYELLTGTTPYDKERLRKMNYDEMRRIICEEEPPKPSTRISTLGKAATTVSTQRQREPKQLSRVFRGELDWIVMKALEKDRNRRYETAIGMARDVQRYLADEPVLACPPSVWYRSRKFARRNKTALAVASLVLLCIALVGGGGGWLVRDRVAQQREAEGRVTETLNAAEPLLREGHPWDTTLISAVQRVKADLDSGVLGPEVRRRAKQFWQDVRMLADLDEIRLRQAESKDGAMFDSAGTEERYAAAFAAYGLDVAALEPTEAATQIRASGIREVLLAGLDVWIQIKPVQDRERLRAVADAADESAWRRAFREAASTGDSKKLQELAGQKEALTQPPGVLAWLGSVLDAAGLRKETEAILRQAQQRYPQDFWINYNLGHFLIWGPPWRPDQAVGYFRAAVAIRPASAEAHSILGLALLGKGDTDEAIASLRQAVALDAEFPIARNNLGSALRTKGQLDEAIAEFRAAIRLKMDDPRPHSDVGNVLMAKGQLDEAFAEFSKAIELQPDLWEAWWHRANAYRELHQYDKAIADYSKAIQLEPKRSELWSSRGFTYLALRQWDKCIQDYTKAIELAPDVHTNWWHRGIAYTELGQWDKLVADYSKLLEKYPSDCNALLSRAGAYVKLNQPELAMADLHQAVAKGYTELQILKKDDRLAPLRTREDFKKLLAEVEVKAQEALRRAITLNEKAAAAHPDQPGPRDGLARSQFNLALLLQEIGQKKEAARAFREAIAIWDKLAADFPTKLDYQRHVAYTYHRLPSVLPNEGQSEKAEEAYSKAIAHWSKAIEVDPKNAAFWNNRGCCYEQLGNPEKAIADYSKVLELAPEYIPALLRRSGLYAELGQWDNTRQDYAKILELSPSSAMAHNNLAWLLAICPLEKLRDPKRAVELAKKAVELAPNERDNWNTLGVAQYRCHDFQAAITALQKSMELRQGGDSFDWVFLAMAHEQLGNQKEARTWYDKAVVWQEKNQPKNEELSRFRAEAAKLLGVNDKK